MADRSDRSDGESGNERAHPHRGLSSAPLCLGAGGSSTAIPAVRREALHVTAPPRLDAPRAESGGTTTADARFRAEARGEARRLAAALVALAFPQGAGACTPEGEWLDELASLVRKAAPGPKAQSSSATHGEPTAQLHIRYLHGRDPDLRSGEG